MLLVDHDMGLVLSVCDHVVVLDSGKVIARGAPAEVRRRSLGHRLPRARVNGSSGSVIVREQAWKERDSGAGRGRRRPRPSLSLTA